MSKKIVSNTRFQLTVERICHHLIEQHGNFENSCLIGIQPRGTHFAQYLHKRLLELLPVEKIEYGVLDVTFYRDDYRGRPVPLSAHPTEMNFILEGKRAILVDDVLYTGRTIRAALSAMQHYGRPKDVELATLVDRRFNRHLPIQPNYTGLVIDAVDKAYIKVEWEHVDGENQILLYADKSEIE